jgi:hypothetical protein
MSLVAIEQTISKRLVEFEDRLQVMRRHETEQLRHLRDRYTQSFPGTTEGELIDCFDMLEKHIHGLTVLCLSELAKDSAMLEQMQRDIDKVQGTLFAIRGNVERHQILLSLPLAPRAPDVALPPASRMEIEIPMTEFQLNVRVLCGVGARPEDLEDPEDPENPEDLDAELLIRTIPPGQPQPQFWSRTDDFFITDRRDSFSTSFSEFFGFDPAACFDALPWPEEAPLSTSPSETHSQGHGKGATKQKTEKYHRRHSKEHTDTKEKREKRPST